MYSELFSIFRITEWVINDGVKVSEIEDAWIFLTDKCTNPRLILRFLISNSSLIFNESAKLPKLKVLMDCEYDSHDILKDVGKMEINFIMRNYFRREAQMYNMHDFEIFKVSEIKEIKTYWEL